MYKCKIRGTKTRCESEIGARKMGFIRENGHGEYIHADMSRAHACMHENYMVVAGEVACPSRCIEIYRLVGGTYLVAHN